MDSAEHTASASASSPKNGRGLRWALFAALVLLALGWIGLRAYTESVPDIPTAVSPGQSSRNVQGVIRMPPVPEAARAAVASSLTLAGLKLERSIQTPIPAEPETVERAGASAAE